jgi:threonine dehydrogenase-like Zn-dependent dehydrogenase
MPAAMSSFMGNVTLSCGPAPVRVYIEELLADIVDGRIEPGRVFDGTVGFDEVPDGYREMNDRAALKVLVAL